VSSLLSPDQSGRRSEQDLDLPPTAQRVVRREPLTSSLHRWQALRKHRCAGNDTRSLPRPAVNGQRAKRTRHNFCGIKSVPLRHQTHDLALRCSTTWPEHRFLIGSQADTREHPKQARAVYGSGSLPGLPPVAACRLTPRCSGRHPCLRTRLRVWRRSLCLRSAAQRVSPLNS
jgi:hypothetical protein